MRKKSLFRLLPGVMALSGCLLALNTSGLIHRAYAGIDTTAPEGALAAPKPENKDFAGDQAETPSASEVDVLTSLAKRRSELDARQARIDAETTVLAATESRVDGKIAQLKALETQIAALLAQRDAAQQKQVTALVKTYSAMKPKDAARIFDNLDEGVLLAVAEDMKSDALAPVLAAMSPQAAQKLTLKLASKLALPATLDPAPQATDPAKPATQAAPEAPKPVGTAAPKISPHPPAQTAAKPAPKAGG